MGSSWFSFIFTTWGVCLVGALDSTLIFFLPVAVDLGVVVLSSRTPRFFWLFPILVSASSLVGAAVTFYVGRRIGEAGIGSFVSERKLKRAKGAMKTSGAIAMAALDLIPPPFPFTALILAAGALDVGAPRFLTALFAVRIIRFGAEATLAAIYGRQIVGLLQSDVAREIAEYFIVLLLIGSLVSSYRVFGKSRRSRRQTRAPQARVNASSHTSRS